MFHQIIDLKSCHKIIWRYLWIVNNDDKKYTNQSVCSGKLYGPATAKNRKYLWGGSVYFIMSWSVWLVSPYKQYSLSHASLPEVGLTYLPTGQAHVGSPWLASVSHVHLAPALSIHLLLHWSGGIGMYLLVCRPTIHTDKVQNLYIYQILYKQMTALTSTCISWYHAAIRVIEGLTQRA